MAENQLPKVPTDEQQLERERSEIREAVADAWQAWAQFEDTLAMLLEQAVRSRLHTLGLALYYVPNNTETRINIVDVCVRRYLRDYQIDQLLLPSWETIIAQTDKAKNTRNRIIHGSLIIHVSKRGKQSFRLSGQLFDLERSAHPTNQLPGMSAHDITTYLAKLRWLRSACEMMLSIIFSANKGCDANTLRAISLQLSTYLQNTPDRHKAFPRPAKP